MKSFLITIALALSTIAIASAGQVKVFVLLGSGPMPHAEVVQTDANGKTESKVANNRGEATFDVADYTVRHCWSSKVRVHVEYGKGRYGWEDAHGEVCHRPVLPIVYLSIKK